jgi:hypothetical protein
VTATRANWHPSARARVCSMFARMSRYGTVADGTRRHRVLRGAAQSDTSWHVPALADTGKLAEQRTLNLRVRGSSPWRRTHLTWGFIAPGHFLCVRFVPMLAPRWLVSQDPIVAGLSNLARFGPLRGLWRLSWLDSFLDQWSTPLLDALTVGFPRWSRSVKYAGEALPLVISLQRFLRHAQLVSASRIDSKTGLLNDPSGGVRPPPRWPGRCGPDLGRGRHGRHRPFQEGQRHLRAPGRGTSPSGSARKSRGSWAPSTRCPPVSPCPSAWRRPTGPAAIWDGSSPSPTRLCTRRKPPAGTGCMSSPARNPAACKGHRAIPSRVQACHPRTRHPDSPPCRRRILTSLRRRAAGRRRHLRGRHRAARRVTGRRWPRW